MDKKVNNKILIIIITIIGIVAAVLLGYFLYLRYSFKKSLPPTEETTTTTNSTTTFSPEEIKKILDKLSAPVENSSSNKSLEAKNNIIPNNKLKIIQQKISAPQGSSITIPKEVLNKLSAPE